jgi:hypothetical protein
MPVILGQPRARFAVQGVIERFPRGDPEKLGAWRRSEQSHETRPADAGGRQASRRFEGLEPEEVEACPAVAGTVRPVPPGKAGQLVPAPGPGAGRAPREGGSRLPTVFAVGEQLLRNADATLFAAFGSVTMLLFVQFGGGLRRSGRRQATSDAARQSSVAAWRAAPAGGHHGTVTAAAAPPSRVGSGPGGRLLGQAA